MTLVETVQRTWGWTGIQANEVRAINAFGHLIVEDADGSFWYLDPELQTLGRIATDIAALNSYIARDEVRDVWEAKALARLAEDRLGAPPPGHCYALKTLALLEGDYAPENLCVYPIDELISFCGNIAEQTRDLPDGATYRLKVVD